MYRLLSTADVPLHNCAPLKIPSPTFYALHILMTSWAITRSQQYKLWHWVVRAKPSLIIVLSVCNHLLKDIIEFTLTFYLLPFCVMGNFSRKYLGWKNHVSKMFLFLYVSNAFFSFCLFVLSAFRDRYLNFFYFCFSYLLSYKVNVTFLG